MMKKLIASVLASAMLVGFSGALAAENLEAPSLIYNNVAISGDTADSTPFISDDRTMLPFRYLLDQIGAAVDYDEETRIVKAEKDGVSIEFSLDDTYIDITKDGETERVVQDTPNVIQDDRVFVPIRFMSEAFGLNVGWDAYERTAIIVDMQKYASELLEASPKLKQYMEIASEIPDNYTETISMTFDFSLDDSSGAAEGEDFDINFSFGIDGDLSLNGGAVQSDITAGLDTNLIEKLAGISLTSIEDVQFTFIYNDGQFYAKTNLIDKLKEIAPDEEFLNGVGFVADSNTWFKADITELFETLGIPVEMIDLVKSSLSGDVAGGTFEQAMSSVPVEITSVYQAQMMDAMFDMYPVMYEEMLSITDNGDGNYDVQINFTKDGFMKMVEDMMRPLAKDMSEEDFQLVMDEISNAVSLEMTGSTKIENNMATASNAAMKMAIVMEGVSMNLDMNVESALTPDTNKEITVPEDAINLIDILKLFI